jgi:hypothetical protein
MIDRGIRSQTLARWAAGIAAVAVCWGAGAAAASAATLRITVPAKVKKNAGYAIAIRGTFAKSEVQNGRAFLVSVIQFSPKPCLGSVQAESNAKRPLQFYLAPKGDPTLGNIGVFKSSSPFTNVKGFTAKSVGRRRICSYLYPKLIAKPSDTTPPIAKAQASYKVTR